MRTKRGFTLIEFMVIASALGIMGAIGVHLYAVHQVRPTRHTLGEVRKALETYKAETGSYPATLDPVVEKKLLPELPKDQWGRPMDYRLSAGVPQTFSSGPDGVPDNQDDVVKE